MEHIYADVSSCDSVLICLPIENPNLNNPDLGSFFKKIMFSTQFDQTENCDHVAKLINHLNGSPVFSLEEFKKTLDDIKAEGNKQPAVTKAKVEPKVETTVIQQKQPTAQQTNSVQTQPVVTKTETPKSIPVTATSVPTAISQQTRQAPATAEEKGMSWFYLMQHYSKENAAAYKAQKEAAKKKPAHTSSMSQKNTTKQTSTPNNLGYAVPGVPVQQPVASTTPVQQTVVQNAPVRQPVQQTVVNQQPAYIPPQMPQGQSMNFGETTVLGGGDIGETTVLGSTPAVQVKPHLIRAKNNEKIDLNKPVFRIGKEKSYVDYFIGDNSAISRSHANIVSRDGEYFVVDTNSTNHTYVNGQMIQSNVETKIVHGTKIRLANEDFEFRLY